MLAGSSSGLRKLCLTGADSEHHFWASRSEGIEIDGAERNGFAAKSVIPKLIIRVPQGLRPGPLSFLAARLKPYPSVLACPSAVPLRAKYRGPSPTAQDDGFTGIACSRGSSS